jgi:hypothetical protein|nr:hypothetical protein [Candidatus Krumholzibacteria bacterium]
MKTCVVLQTVVSILIISAASQAAVYVVDPSGGGDFLNLEGAIPVVIDGDVLEFVDGIHSLDSSTQTISVDLTLRSVSGDSDLCELTSESTLLLWATQFIQFQNLTIHGIGLWLIDSYSIDQCKFLDASIAGRALGAISSCTFTGSLADFISGPHLITGTEFLGESRVARGMYSSGEEPGLILTITESTFSENSRIEIAQSGGELRISETSFSGMSGQPCVFLLSFIADLEIDSCLFSDNDCGDYAAVQSGPLSEVTVVNSTFRHNQSTGVTAGINASGTSYCENVDFVNNSAMEGSHDAFVSLGAELHLNCCEINEANIGGEGVVTITNQGCTVPTEVEFWGGLKAMFR